MSTTLTLNDMPNKLELVCKKTGAKKIWTVKACMLKAAIKHGSLQAFVDQYVCREAKGTTAKVPTDKLFASEKKALNKASAPSIKPILETGVAIGNMSVAEYEAKYVVRTHEFKDGINCTVAVPRPPAPVFAKESGVVAGAAAKAVAAVAA